MIKNLVVAWTAAAILLVIGWYPSIDVSPPWARAFILGGLATGFLGSLRLE